MKVGDGGEEFLNKLYVFSAFPHQYYILEQHFQEQTVGLRSKLRSREPVVRWFQNPLFNTVLIN